MLTIGLTGGIGSGKTVVANIFASLGVPLIDADAIAKELTLKNQPSYHAIAKYFGTEIMKADGEIDRKKLRILIFQKPNAKKWLENLLHPQIRKTIEDRVSAVTHPYCIISIPLLIENQAYNYVDRILVIESRLELRIERTMIRDQIPREEVLKVIKSQVTSEERLLLADDIIFNNGDLESLSQEIDKLNTMYLKLSER